MMLTGVIFSSCFLPSCAEIFNREEICKDRFCTLCYNIINYEESTEYSESLIEGCYELLDMSNCCSIYINGQGSVISRVVSDDMQDLEDLFNKKHDVISNKTDSSESTEADTSSSGQKIEVPWGKLIIGFMCGAIFAVIQAAVQEFLDNLITPMFD
ncbi:Oidioi.mRNA.OKI2018_I69.PAR.g10774.t1.cds [Oikopleura dioica]|uniref:Oidioi.mRNA.OKI2018_I69.PAR.g10774.t1.cds n=1 Tax=Oikopleura dioica TaxID=34765 RepID=A0ABN7RT54_OIKDI|nr:Oidioi.mRNA.OKI2018_I69.PAR.g10774.t1.cds [Oikopleura dioica]